MRLFLGFELGFYPNKRSITFNSTSVREEILIHHYTVQPDFYSSQF